MKTKNVLIPAIFLAIILAVLFLILFIRQGKLTDRIVELENDLFEAKEKSAVLLMATELSKKEIKELVERINSLESDISGIRQETEALTISLKNKGAILNYLMEPLGYHNTPVSGKGIAVSQAMSDGSQGYFYSASIGELPLIKELPSNFSGNKVKLVSYVSGGRESWIKDPSLALARGYHGVKSLQALGISISHFEIRYGQEGEHGVFLEEIPPKEAKVVLKRVEKPIERVKKEVVVKREERRPSLFLNTFVAQNGWARSGAEFSFPVKKTDLVIGGGITRLPQLVSGRAEFDMSLLNQQDVFYSLTNYPAYNEMNLYPFLNLGLRINF